MTELDVLRQLAASTKLLTMRPTVEEMRQTAYQFTVKAAQALRDAGWALLRAPAGGNNVDGNRIDKLIHRVTLEIRDIIVNADDPTGQTRTVGWGDAGTGASTDVVNPPVVVEPPGPPAPPLPPPGPPAPSADVAALLEKVDDLGELLLEGGALLKDLDLVVHQMQSQGILIRFR